MISENIAIKELGVSDCGNETKGNLKGSPHENGEPGKGAKFTIIIPKLSKTGKENYLIIVSGE
jgi:hypothetical protein